MFTGFKKVYGWLIAAGLVLFALAWVPSDSSLSWLATIGWLGFMLAIVAIIILTLALTIRTALRRRRVSAPR